jgi:hypothetical protein
MHLICDSVKRLITNAAEVLLDLKAVFVVRPQVRHVDFLVVLSAEDDA